MLVAAIGVVNSAYENIFIHMQTDHLQQCMMMDTLGLVLERDCELKLQGDVMSLVVHYKGQCHSGLVAHVRSVTHIQETMHCPFVCDTYTYCALCRHMLECIICFCWGEKVKALHLFNPQLCNGR